MDEGGGGGAGVQLHCGIQGNNKIGNSLMLDKMWKSEGKQELNEGKKTFPSLTL